MKQFRGYRWRWLRSDLLAGTTVWAMLVPQALGYAALAGLPTVSGLYAACGALLAYWIWGSSRELNVGPEATVAIMVAAALSSRAQVGSNEYLGMAALLALLVGLVLVVAGLFRLGRVADFLSRPILAGYVFGSGLLVVASQLPNLVGIDVDTDRYFNEVFAVVDNLHDVDWTALLVGAATIAIVMLCNRISRAIPGALLALSVAVVFVAAVDPGIPVVGEFASGFPSPSLPAMSLSKIVALLPSAAAIAVLVYPDSLLTARSIAARRSEPLRPNREFIGIGAANICSGLLGGFPVNGSQSRTFVLADAGGRSQLANLWAVGLTLVALATVAKLFAYVPKAALAGVVTVAGLSLLRSGDFVALWRYRKVEFGLAACTIVGVVVLGVLQGILVAVGLSILAMVLKAASPNAAILGRVPGTDTYRDLEDHPDAETYPGLVIYRFDANLFFANAGKLMSDLLKAVEGSEPPVEEILLDAESIYDIDSTGAHMLRQLIRSLDEGGVGLTMARVRTELRDELEAAGIEERLTARGVYLEVDDAVEDFLARHRPSRG